MGRRVGLKELDRCAGGWMCSPFLPLITVSNFGSCLIIHVKFVANRAVSLLGSDPQESELASGNKGKK